MFQQWPFFRKILRAVLLVVLPVAGIAWRLSGPFSPGGHLPGSEAASPGKETIRCFARSIDIQVLPPDGKVRRLLSFTDRVFFYNNLILYRRDGHIDSAVNGETVLSEDRYSYFAFEKDSLYGIQYNTFDQKRLSVDSVKKLAVLGFGLTDLLKPGTTRLVSSTKGSRTGRPTEVYCDLGTVSPSDKDSLYLYFTDRFKETFLSLSHEMDSTRQLQLCRARVVFAPRIDKNNQGMTDQMEVNLELEERIFFNRDSAMLYFDRYKMDCGLAR